jgi:hypothetical protein
LHARAQVSGIRHDKPKRTRSRPYFSTSFTDAIPGKLLSPRGVIGCMPAASLTEQPMTGQARGRSTPVMKSAEEGTAATRIGGKAPRLHTELMSSSDMPPRIMSGLS